MVRSRSRFLVFAIGCAFAAACFTIAGAPQSVFPDIVLARVEVFAHAPGMPAESVRAAVALPLERALATLPGLRATRTYADPGELELELDFDPAGDPENDLRAVRAAVAGVREGLPVTDVTSLVEGPEMEPVQTFAFTSASTGQAELQRRLEAAFVPVFTGAPQLGRITAFGGPRRTVEVVLDPRLLAARRMLARDVADAIARVGAARAAGTFVRGQERLSVFAGAPPDGAAGLASLALAGGVRLHDVGRVLEADEDTGTQASFDGRHAVLVNFYSVPHGDAVALANAVAERLPALRAGLPADTAVTLAWDQTRLIDASQRALRIEMAIGALIALAVIAWFLRDLALVLVAAIVLPVATALTVFILVRAGLRLDLMTLGGLAIAMGLIVDEAIVVVEAISRALEGGRAASRRAAITPAVRRIAKPLIASTAANVVVFLPLGLLGGVPGFFFRALAITLAVALIVSIALSLGFAPLLADAFGAGGRAARAPQRLERAYVAGLRLIARRPWLAYAGAVAIVAAAAVVLARTPTDFLPSVDEGEFEIKYAMPPGMSLAAADAIATRMEQTILLDRAVAHVARLSGVDTNGYVATPPDAGTLRVTLKPDALRDPFDPIADRMRDAIADVNPYVAVEVHQLLEDQINDLSGAPEPLQLTVSGPSQPVLAKLAGLFADDLSHTPGVVDTFDGVTWEARGVRASPRGAPVARAAFDDELRARLDGIAAGAVTTPSGDVPVVVRVADRTPLDRFAALGPPQLSSTVREENGNRIVLVTAGIEGADLSTTIARIEAKIAPGLRALPPGYSAVLGGTVLEQRAAFAEFAKILGIALLLVFGVLLATFDSFRLPLVVLSAIPLTPIGVAAALVLTKTPLNVASFMGMLLLVGIVVRNGILLVEGANRRVREGASAIEAMERSAVERLRPILMTTFATLGALAPLAAGIGAGSEMERPLAIAVIGGITAATALTLAIVPVLYLSLAPARVRRDARRSSA